MGTSEKKVRAGFQRTSHPKKNKINPNNKKGNNKPRKAMNHQD
jgi:hypothetical protein